MFTHPAVGKTRLYLRLRRTAQVVCEVNEKAGELRFCAPSTTRFVPPPTPEPEASATPTEPSPNPAPSAAVPVPAEPRLPVAPSDPDDGSAPMLYPRPDSAD
jgi:hypothetical protein